MVYPVDNWSVFDVQLGMGTMQLNEGEGTYVQPMFQFKDDWEVTTNDWVISRTAYRYAPNSLNAYCDVCWLTYGSYGHTDVKHEITPFKEH